MYKRFRDSIVYPKRILQFRKDSFLLVFSYLFLFGLIMSLGMLVAIIRFDGFGSSFYNFVEDNIVDVTLDCQITDGLLACTPDSNELIYNDGLVEIYLNGSSEFSAMDYRSSFVNIVVFDDRVIVLAFGIPKTFLLEDLPQEFQNIDFATIITDKEALTAQLVDGLTVFLQETQSTWSIYLMILDFLSNIFFVLFITLINSWMLRMRFPIIPFKETFKMSAYLGTSLYLLFVFYGLIDLDFLFMLLLVILTIRQTNSLSNEIMRVIKKK